MLSIRRTLATAAIGGLAAVLTASGAGAATGVTGPHSTPSVRCNGVEINAPAPTMKAVNSTAGTDRQVVAFQPVLFRWDSTTAKWVQFSAYEAVYGYATDAAKPAVWYQFGTGANRGNGANVLTLTSKGYFRVAYHMWWKTGSSWTGSDYLWSSGTYTQSAIGAVTPGPAWCYR